MKIWHGYGSEHSMNLVMIGKFEDASSATTAKWVIDSLTEQVNADIQAGAMHIGEQREKFGDAMLELLQKVKFYSVQPSELEQFAYDVTVEVKGDKVIVRTDESDVSAFLKVLLHKGAHVEVFSAHDYPEPDDKTER